MTVRFAPSKATLLPCDDGLRPSPPSMMPALTSSSLYLPIASMSSVEGMMPASLSAVDLTNTNTRIGHLLSLAEAHSPPALTTNEWRSEEHTSELQSRK